MTKQRNFCSVNCAENWPERISRLLAAYGWSQARCAMRLQCHVQTVGNWVHGRTAPIQAYRSMIEELEFRKGLRARDDETT
ncbi:helix-turn-helix domain-containing protein [bacterium]|nr:helix-turn-helix domain-containing protein [bacterium]MBU1921106.1 helix-turn-helix domain-containing protein [bacterium]